MAHYLLFIQSLSKKNGGLRRATTLIELLVVIAIIGILVGLLFPAVQSAREFARRSSCSHRMAQIGIAFHNFELSYGSFPSGVTNASGPIRYEPIGDHTSWTIRLMPFMEQGIVRNQYDPVLGAYASENRDIRSNSASIYRCPSNPNYTLNGAPTPESHLSNFAGNSHSSEKPIDSDNDGVLYLNSRMKLDDIKDGTSQTLLVGEKLSYNDKFGWLSGTRDTLRNALIRPDATNIESWNDVYRRMEEDLADELSNELSDEESHDDEEAIGALESNLTSEQADELESAEQDHSVEAEIAVEEGSSQQEGSSQEEGIEDEEDTWEEDRLDEEEDTSPKTLDRIIQEQELEVINYRNPLYVGGFSSYHNDGFNALRCDGAVQFISTAIAPEVLKALSNRHNGITPSSPPNW